MELLQRLHRKLAVTFCGTDAFYSCLCSSHGCNIRNTVLNGSLTNVAVVGCTLLAAGSIDNQLDLVIRDLIQDVRTSLVELAYLQGRNTGLFDQVTGSAGCHNFKAKLIEASCNVNYLCLISVINRNQHAAGSGQLGLCRFFCLEECITKVCRQSKNLTGGTHFRSEYRVNLREHIEGEYRFFYTVVSEFLFFQLRHRALASGIRQGNDIRCNLNHVDAADLGYKRNGSGCTGICLDDKYLAVLNRILHIHQANNMQLLCDLSGVVFQSFDLLFCQSSRGNDTSRVTGVNTSQLDMLHNRRNEYMLTIAYCVRFTLGCMMQESVNQDRSVRCYTHCLLHVEGQRFIVINDLHAASAKNVGRTNHNRIADSVSSFQCFFHIDSHACFRHRNLQLLHHFTELVTVFCKVDGFRSGSKNIDTVFLQVCCQIQRSLSTELCNNANRLFFFINCKDIFQSQRLEIQLVGSVVVCGYRLRVTVYNDRGESELTQCFCSMYAAVIEFDTLTDSVRTAAEDHYLLFAVIYRAFVLDMIAGVIVCGILSRTYMNTFPAFHNAKLCSACPNCFLGYTQDLA